MSGCGGCDGSTLPSGPAGADGRNAFTLTTANFTQPAVGANVNVSVLASGQSSIAWAGVGQAVFIVDGTGKGGYYEVVSVNSSVGVTVKLLSNLSGTSTSNTIASGAKFSPSGVAGASGSAGAAGASGANGQDGVAVLFNDYTHARRTANSYGAVKTYAIPADTLDSAGDILRIEAVVIGETSAAYSTNYKFKMELGGVQCGPEVLLLMDDQYAEQNGLKIVLDVVYLTNTTFTGKADRYAVGGGILLPSASVSTDHILTTAKIDWDSARYNGTGVTFDVPMNLVMSTMSDGTKNIVVCNVKITKYKI